MRNANSLIVLALAALSFAAPAEASTRVFRLHNHPSNALLPPMYGFRWDNLFGTGGEYTFSFDHNDGSELADVRLTYDTSANTIRIAGRAYGGKDIGSAWHATQRGWINIDFTYRASVHSGVDNKNLVAGNDYYVTAMNPTNNGGFSLDGWGGNLVVNMIDKFGTDDGYSFAWDNDYDSKGNQSVANNPLIWSGDGWVTTPDMQMISGSRDWIFIGDELIPLPVRETTWGAIKSLLP